MTTQPKLYESLLDNPFARPEPQHYQAEIDFDHCQVGKCRQCTKGQQAQCERELDRAIAKLWEPFERVKDASNI